MNPLLRKFFCNCFVIATAFTAKSLWAAGVSVGSSALIETLHYSDTFTISPPDRTEGAGATGNGLNVENSYGNPTMTWSPGQWSIESDANPYPGPTPFPGDSGAGNASGMAQTGIGSLFSDPSFPFHDFGIEYGLSNHYVVQFDAVQVNDRINITSSTARNTIFGATDGTGKPLSVFIRGDGRTEGGPNVSLFSPSVGETNTQFALSGIGVAVGEWANYAVRFDQVNNEIEIFINEVSLGGVLDLTTFAGGAYAGWSNSAVSVGGHDFREQAILWSDNFQVGAAIPIPEPTGSFLALSAFACAAVSRRRTK